MILSLLCSKILTAASADVLKEKELLLNNLTFTTGPDSTTMVYSEQDSVKLFMNLTEGGNSLTLDKLVETSAINNMIALFAAGSRPKAITDSLMSAKMFGRNSKLFEDIKSTNFGYSTGSELIKHLKKSDAFVAALTSGEKLKWEIPNELLRKGCNLALFGLSENGEKVLRIKLRLSLRKDLVADEEMCTHKVGNYNLNIRFIKCKSTGDVAKINEISATDEFDFYTKAQEVMNAKYTTVKFDPVPVKEAVVKVKPLPVKKPAAEASTLPIKEPTAEDTPTPKPEISTSPPRSILVKTLLDTSKHSKKQVCFPEQPEKPRSSSESSPKSPKSELPKPHKSEVPRASKTGVKESPKSKVPEVPMVKSQEPPKIIPPKSVEIEDKRIPKREEKEPPKSEEEIIPDPPFSPAPILDESMIVEKEGEYKDAQTSSSDKFIDEIPPPPTQEAPILLEEPKDPDFFDPGEQHWVGPLDDEEFEPKRIFQCGSRTIDLDLKPVKSQLTIPVETLYVIKGDERLDYKSQLSDIEANLARHDDSNANITTPERKIKDARKARKAAIETFREQFEDQETKLSMATDDLDRANAELDSLKSQIATLSVKPEDMMEDPYQLNQQKARLEKENFQIQKILTEEQDREKQAESEIKKLQAEITAIKAALEKADQEGSPDAKETRKSLEHLMSQKSDREEEITKLSSTKDSKQAEYDNIELSRVQAKNKLDADEKSRDKITKDQEAILSSPVSPLPPYERPFAVKYAWVLMAVIGVGSILLIGMLVYGIYLNKKTSG